MARQSDDFDDLPLRRRRAERAGTFGWFGMFSAVFCAVLLAGLVLGVGVRLYIHWSLADTARQVNDRHHERAAEKDEKGKR